jgi:hypothetical protein
MFKLVRSNRMMRQFSMLDDDYIEHMANIYTSEEAKNIYQIYTRSLLRNGYINNILWILQ